MTSGLADRVPGGYDVPGGGTLGIDRPFAEDESVLPERSYAPPVVGLGIALIILSPVYGAALALVGIVPLVWGAVTWLGEARADFEVVARVGPEVEVPEAVGQPR